MSENLILKLRGDVERLHKSLVTAVDELEKKAINPSDGVALNNKTELSLLMKKKRKEAGLSMEDLELQTGLSYSTLKRIFSDPSRARYSNVIKILNELGIKSWAEK